MHDLVQQRYDMEPRSANSCLRFVNWGAGGFHPGRMAGRRPRGVGGKPYYGAFRGLTPGLPRGAFAGDNPAADGVDRVQALRERPQQPTRLNVPLVRGALLPTVPPETSSAVSTAPPADLGELRGRLCRNAPWHPPRFRGCPRDAS